MALTQTLELPIAGMDCTECTRHVHKAIAALPGVESAEVLLSSEKAIVRLDPARVTLPMIRKAVAEAGYSVPALTEAPARTGEAFTRKALSLFAFVFGAVILIVVAGEWLGWLDRLTDLVPFPVGAALVALTGWPIFVNVVRAALKRQLIAHTLMSLGVLAALAIGQWTTAAVVVFFMRVGDFTESMTAEGARRAVKDLTKLAPQKARVEQDGSEQEVAASTVTPGQIVVVRPGELIPVDGEVISGRATINQASITGESMPVEVAAGSRVFAATVAQLGSLRVRAARVGADSTFGRIIKLVEEAEAHRAEVQRFADKFTNYYLPIVAVIALLTFIIRRDPLATAAVLLVACSCSIALATPIAMLASVGAGAKRGLLIKGGKYLETLARADVLLIDKTGTLTLGRPRLTDIVPLNGLPAGELLALAAAAEKYSEHPLAEAVRAAARDHKLAVPEPEGFESLPGLGVRATVNGQAVTVGSGRMANPSGQAAPGPAESHGKTLLYVSRDGHPLGWLAAADTLRPEVPAALAAIRKLGLRQIELLTGDNEHTASALAGSVRVGYRAGLLPEDKIAVVKDYQSKGRTVVMVGDGVNDAPALAQADVGIAMGAAGADIAIEAAHVTLLRDDWTQIPELFRMARRTMGVVKTNLIFTAIYNILGLSLAAFGLLPPIVAAAAQSLPDLGILANSARLLRIKDKE